MLEFLTKPENYLGDSDTEEAEEDSSPSTFKNVIEQKHYSDDEEAQPLLKTEFNEGLKQKQFDTEKGTNGFFAINSQQMIFVWVVLQLVALTYVVCVGMNSLLETDSGMIAVADGIIDEEQRTFVNLQNFFHMY